MCAVTGAVAELLFEIVFSPFGYRIVAGMEREGVGQAYLDLIAPKAEPSDLAEGKEAENAE